MFSLKLQEGQKPFSLSNIGTVMNVSTKLKSRHEVILNIFLEWPKMCSLYIVLLDATNLSSCLPQYIWICNIISPLSVDTLSHTPVHIYLLDKQSKGLRNLEPFISVSRVLSPGLTRWLVSNHAVPYGLDGIIIKKNIGIFGLIRKDKA
jgi:hypothetical protein